VQPLAPADVANKNLKAVAQPQRQLSGISTQQQSVLALRKELPKSVAQLE
jgi:hypothetical protein